MEEINKIMYDVNMKKYPESRGDCRKSSSSLSTISWTVRLILRLFLVGLDVDVILLVGDIGCSDTSNDCTGKRFFSGITNLTGMLR